MLFLCLGFEEGLELCVGGLAGWGWGGELWGGLALFYPGDECLDIFLMFLSKLI